MNWIGKNLFKAQKIIPNSCKFNHKSFSHYILIPVVKFLNTSYLISRFNKKFKEEKGVLEGKLLHFLKLES